MSSDVIVIGGGPAGLQAALTVARVGRSVTVLDSGVYRNAAARHMHNYAGADGVPPAQQRERARADLAAYPTVRLLDREATQVVSDDDHFVVEAGGRLRAAAVVLATGVRDELPDVPGLSDLWGTGVAHCPFRHGYEMRGRTVAVLGNGPQVRHVALLMSPLAGRVVLLADGEPVDVELVDDLEDRGVEVVPDPVSRMCPSGDGVGVAFGSGRTLDVGGVFVTPRMVQRAPFAEQLGLTMLPSGCVEVDDMQRTSRPGVLAAGDMAHRAALPMPMAAVVAAAASGQVAAAAAVAGLLAR